VRIDVVELGRGDQGIHRRGTLAAAIGAREQPGAAPQGNAAQGALGGIVAEAEEIHARIYEHFTCTDIVLGVPRA
jgi:hypothetical protein